ncbi:hypothetical protein AHF37_01980 [Paragonimus kellicotti]|nr:hypothetical protein AHF37_01980 [Paragonimus kellicotti]
MAVTETAALRLNHSEFRLGCNSIDWEQKSPSVPQDDEHTASENSTRMSGGWQDGNRSSAFYSVDPELLPGQFDKLLNCLQNLNRVNNILCIKHRKIVERLLPKMESTRQHCQSQLYSQPHCSGASRAQQEQAFMCGLAHIKQIYRCSKCHILLKEGGNLYNYKEAFGSLLTLYRQMRMIRPKTRVNEKIAWIKHVSDRQPNLFCTESSLILEPGKPIDHLVNKVNYCWQWLLCPLNDGAKTVHPPLATGSTLPNTVPRSFRQYNSGYSADVHSDQIRTGLSVWGLSHALSDGLSAGKSRECISMASDSPMEREISGGSDPSRDMEMDLRSRTRHFPCQVSRRPQLRAPRIRLHTCEYRSNTSPCSLTSPSRKILKMPDPAPERHQVTPWLSTRTQQRFNSDLWSAFSNLSLCPTPEVHMRHDSQTMQFLSSISPNMNIIPPPNHNPFAKNESI